MIETAIKDSPVLQRLPFIEITGNGLTYNRENSAATAAFYNVGDAWAESMPTFTQVTASLAILGGDADVDNYVARTRSNVQDIEAAIVELKAKAVQQQFDTTFVDGDTSSNAKARAAARANAVLRRSHLALARGELTARPHPGLEVGDAIAVTSARAGLAAERFRVAGLRLRYVRGGPRAVYEQRIALGAT